jgi:hypothetical protein
MNALELGISQFCIDNVILFSNLYTFFYSNCNSNIAICTINNTKIAVIEAFYQFLMSSISSYSPSNAANMDDDKPD